MSTSPLSISRFRIIFIIVWLILIANHTGLLMWYGFSFKIAVIDSIVGNTHLLMASLLLINTLQYYLPRKERFIHLFFWCILLTIILILLNRWAISSFLRHEELYLVFFKKSVFIRSSIYFLIIGCVALMSTLWYIRIDQEENEKIKLDAEKHAKEAELFKLRQQLQPHFLFNSLNSINALIGSRPEEARKMVQQLSDFLRGTIKKEENQLVTLQEELQYLQLYLDIEKVRFGNRLTTNIECDETIKHLKLPTLLLQPIMENAIKFGLYDTIEETVISLSAKKEENILIIKVINTFDPETSSPKQGIGFGLQSIQRRLYLLFARTDLVTTETNENTFTTTVKIPQI